MANMRSTDPRMALCIITGLSILASSSAEYSNLKRSGSWKSSCKQPHSSNYQLRYPKLNQMNANQVVSVNLQSCTLELPVQRIRYTNIYLWSIECTIPFIQLQWIIQNISTKIIKLTSECHIPYQIIREVKINKI